MAYADYEYYKSVYKGNLTTADFERLSERASDYIDSRTEYILHKAPVYSNMNLSLSTRLKKACCSVAEAYHNIENGGGKVSESVAGYSVSYASGVSKAKTDSERLDDALQLYLPDLVKTAKWI